MYPQSPHAAGLSFSNMEGRKMEDRGGIIGAFSMTSYNSLMRLNVTSASSSLALRRFTTLPSPQTTIFLASGSMVKVSLNSQTLADSNDTVMIEGNHYFPPSSINKDVFSDSQTQFVPQAIEYTRQHSSDHLRYHLPIVPHVHGKGEWPSWVGSLDFMVI